MVSRERPSFRAFAIAVSIGSLGTALAAFALGCAGASEREKVPAEQVRQSLEQTYEAFYNGDIPALKTLISDECTSKERVLETAVGFALVSGGDFSVDLPESALTVAFDTPDRAIAEPKPGGDAPLLNGIPLTEYNPDDKVDFEYEFVNEDGTWRLLDCDDEDFQIEF